MKKHIWVIEGYIKDKYWEVTGWSYHKKRKDARAHQKSLKASNTRERYYDYRVRKYVEAER